MLRIGVFRQIFQKPLSFWENMDNMGWKRRRGGMIKICQLFCEKYTKSRYEIH